GFKRLCISQWDSVFVDIIHSRTKPAIHIGGKLQVSLYPHCRIRTRWLNVQVHINIGVFVPLTMPQDEIDLVQRGGILNIKLKRRTKTVPPRMTRNRLRFLIQVNLVAGNNRHTCKSQKENYAVKLHATKLM